MNGKMGKGPSMAIIIGMEEDDRDDMDEMDDMDDMDDMNDDEYEIDRMKSGGMTKGRDGCAVKGKTKGRMV